ncbi:hypothetical protein [Sphingobium sp.]|uniref:hypothetical protein n=1 Tax=Sphingobium sp. TaxID=1912891 RepID=UPI0028BE97ED|nr:hypothetical protein [Sphingobium sp.]
MTFAEMIFTLMISKKRGASAPMLNRARHRHIGLTTSVQYTRRIIPSLFPACRDLAKTLSDWLKSAVPGKRERRDGNIVD